MGEVALDAMRDELLSYLEAEILLLPVEAQASEPSAGGRAMSGIEPAPTRGLPRMFMRSEPRDKTVCFVLTERERKRLRSMAKSQGITVSALCAEWITERLSDA